MTCGSSNDTKKRRSGCTSLGGTTTIHLSDARRTAAASSMLLMRVLLLLLAVVVTLVPRRFVTPHPTGPTDPARRWRSEDRRHRRGFFYNDRHHDAVRAQHHRSTTTQDRRRRTLQQQRQQRQQSSSSPIINGSYVNLTVLYNDGGNHHQQRGCDDDDRAYELEGLLNGVYSCRCEDSNTSDGYSVVCVTSQPVISSDGRAVTLNTTIGYSNPTGHMVSFRSCYRVVTSSTSSTATGRTSSSGWAAATATEEGCIDATLTDDCHQVSTCSATLSVENGTLAACASCRACTSPYGVDAPAPYPSQELLSLSVNCTNVRDGAQLDGCNINSSSSGGDWVPFMLFPYYASVVDAATFLSSTSSNAATETAGTSSSAAAAPWNLLTCGSRCIVASALGGLLLSFVGGLSVV